MEPYNPSIISFGQLPIELLEIVLDFTPYQSIPNAIRVCKIWAHYLDKKAKYIKEYIDTLSNINMNSRPLHSRNINLHFEFVSSINTDSIWISTELGIYPKFEEDFVKEICVKNIITILRPKVLDQQHVTYVTSGAIKLYLDNQYTVRLNTELNEESDTQV